MGRATHVCSRPGCPNLTDKPGLCATDRQQADRRRGSRQQRGYDHRWQKRRAGFLTRNPICLLCQRLATVADHYPVSRRDLVAQGVPDPDADHRLRPLCASCHGKETAKHQPGGFNAR